MKLNPRKCTFGVEEGMFLGYQINTNGIKVCPDKVDAVLSIQSPKCLKDVQKLNGKLASLNRFLAKSAEKSLPFFKTLKKCTKKSDFSWTKEAEYAFKQMKELIANLPTIIVPEEKEELIIYLAASKEAVNAFEATNNEAEYEALIAGLRITEKMGVKNLQVNVDSKLVANQVNGRYVAKEMDMIKYLEKRANKSMPRMPGSQTVTRNPQEKLNPITSPWPFYKWGIDIAGPFPEGPNKVKFLIVAMDYFIKWIEAKPEATITGNQHFASVKHPQTNGLVERANRSLGEGIKARLGQDNKNWMEEVSHVLWAHRTMIKSSNGDTSFSLTYGTEAVIPAEIRMPTFRIAEVNMAKNDEALEINLELLEEKREQAAIKEERSKRQMEKYYNTKVRNTSFKPGDLVYRSNETSRAEDTGKLGPK
ncbi:reverse transcriptase domain-containing protein [Tanacetum coccineum]